MKRSVDVAIVGGGLAGSTLLQALTKKHLPSHAPLSIAIFDKAGAFGAGMPYSNSIALPFLLLDQAQFLGRPDFLPWIGSHSAEIIHQLRTELPPQAQPWGAQLVDQIEQQTASTAHLPRRVFGDYLREQFTHALASTRRMANLNVEAHTASVTNVMRSAESLWHIDCKNNRRFTAKTVILATGGIARSVSAERCTNPSYIDSPYEQPLPRLQSRMLNVLKMTPAGARRIIIKGSHAAAVELVYAIYLHKNLCRLCDEIVVISPSGRFPAADTVSNRPPYAPKQLRALHAKQDISAEALWKAYRTDHKEAKAQGYSIRDAEIEIGKQFNPTFAQLPANEKRVFVHRCGQASKEARTAHAAHLCCNGV